MTAIVKKDWFIFGSCISSLVLAERLGSMNLNVVLANPAESWGGVFQGIQANKERFDCGMTNFEFDLFADHSSNINEYDPSLKNNLGRYVDFVKKYLSEFTDFHRLSQPRMFFNGDLCDDLLLTNKFDVLSRLSLAQQQAIKKELEFITSNDNKVHPSLKTNQDSIHSKISFYEASCKNHGTTFHELFVEPFFQKVLRISTKNIPSIFHRAGWTPLFYPETLLSQFSNTPQKLKPTYFYYPNSTYFGSFIESIENKLTSCSNVKIIKSFQMKDLDLSCGKVASLEGKIKFDKIAWGSDIAALADHLKIDMHEETDLKKKRANTTMCFLKLHRENRDFMHEIITDLDSDFPFYRVTNQTLCSNINNSYDQVIMESSTEGWQEFDLDNQSIFSKVIKKYDISFKSILSYDVKSFSGMSIPSSLAMERFNKTKIKIEEQFPQVFLIGKSSGYDSNTLNDQIIQSLKIAAQEESS